MPNKTSIKFLLILALLQCSLSLSAAPSDHFVTTWQTTAADTVITIPTFAGETYNYSIDWDNDMIPDQTGITGDAVHDYGVAGVHTIRIFGTFPRIYINNGVEKDKILSIDQWGTNAWSSMFFAFFGATNVVNNALDVPNLSNCSFLSLMFASAESIGTGTANWNWDTSNITAMEAMFADAFSFDEDISSWNISNVISFLNMFSGVTLSTTNYDALLVSWNAQNVQPSIPFTVGNSKYCSQAAQDARANLIAADMWTITDGGLCAEALFRTTWKTNNPGTSNSTSITIPTEPTQTYAYQVDWNGDGDFDDTDEDTIQTGDVTHDYGTIQTSQTINIKGLFPQIYFNNTGDKDKIISIDQWGSNPWSSMIKAFNGASNLINTASDIPDLSNVDSLLQMFRKASSIGSSLDTGNWNWETNNIRFFGSMFDQASSFNKDIGNWDTINAEIFTTMFTNASSFNQDISSWSTANVITVDRMFQQATSFNQDLSGWNFEAVIFDFNSFLKDTAFSTENYDALLIAWNNQSVHSGLILDVGTTSYCSQAAVNARANLTTVDGWTINDGGQNSSCTDELFANGFEDVIIVKSAQQHVNYDFSAINLDTLTQEPHLIVKGVDDYNKENMHIQIRNDLGTIQVRINFLTNQKWLEGSWQELSNPELTTLYWSIK